MSGHEQLERALQVIADFDAGAYDEQTGVTAEQRDVLTRAADPDQQLTLNDFQTLVAMNEHEIADAAYDAGRITLTEGDPA